MPQTQEGTRLLPFSEESERAVLASVLLSPNVLPLISGRLLPEDFYLEKHQLVFRAMLELLEVETAIDLRTLQGALEQQAKLEEIGGIAYLAGLDMDLPDLGRVETYVELVKERSVRRRLILACHDITRDCLDGGVQAAEALARAEKAVLELGEEAVQKGFSRVGPVLSELIPVLEEREAQKGIIGLPTGFVDWDNMTQGLVKGNLIIIAGRPGMGKTSFAVNVAQHVALREGKAVAIFSLEMGDQELVMRILSSEADLSFGNLRAANLSQNQWPRIYEVARRYKEAPLFIDDSPNPTLLELTAKARRLKSEKGLDLVIVDYLQLMQAGGRYESRNLEIAAISRGLKQLAKELEIPVVALSQLSRQPERRTGDHRPQLADLRESGSIEQDADMVCFVYRDEIYNKDDPDVKGLAELIVAKHRNGETGKVDLVFFGENTTFKSLDRQHAGQEPPPF